MMIIFHIYYINCLVCLSRSCPSVRPSIEVLKPRSRLVCPSLCRGLKTQIGTRLPVSLSRSWNPDWDSSVYLYVVHVRFRATTAVVDVASNPPPLQFVSEISKLARMLQQPVDCHNRRSLWCLFGLLLHFDPLLSFCSFLYYYWNFFLCLRINCRMCLSHQESGNRTPSKLIWWW